MNYQTSLWDLLTEKLHPVMRKLNDLSNILLGTKVLILKINRSYRTNNLWATEPTDEVMKFNFVNNARIKYPTEKIELYATRNATSQDMSVKAIDLETLLPIEMILQWEGTADVDLVNVQKGDLIADVHFGENMQDKFIILLEVERIRGVTFGKYITQKVAELSLYRGEMFDDVKAAVTTYLASI